MYQSKQDYLQIGELAQQAGVAVSALRYYQEVGLLEPSYISDSKYRYYQPSDIALAKFIKKSQRLGFSLDEVKQILNERHEGRSPCPKVRVLAKQKIDKLHEQIDELKKLEKELKNYIIETNSALDSSSSDNRICCLIDKAKV